MKVAVKVRTSGAKEWNIYHENSDKTVIGLQCCICGKAAAEWKISNLLDHLNNFELKAGKCRLSSYGQSIAAILHFGPTLQSKFQRR